MEWLHVWESENYKIFSFQSYIQPINCMKIYHHITPGMYIIFNYKKYPIRYDISNDIYSTIRNLTYQGGEAYIKIYESYVGNWPYNLNVTKNRFKTFLTYHNSHVSQYQ